MVTISRMRRHATFEPIDPKTCTWCGVPDVINCANVFENRSRGLGAGIQRKMAFPIESDHRPYNSVNTTVLLCDIHSVVTLHFYNCCSLKYNVDDSPVVAKVLICMIRRNELWFLPRDARSAKRGIAIVNRPSVCPVCNVDVRWAYRLD